MKLVMGADAREDAIDQTDARRRRRDVTPDLGQQRDEGYLAQVG